MQKLLLSLIIIIGGLTIGQIVYQKTKNINKTEQKDIDRTIFFLRDIAFYVMGPIVLINSMWILDLNNISIIAVPFIMIAVLALGSITALGFSKLFKHNRRQQGAMYCSGSCSNIGAIGALICFAFFGETGLAYSVLYKLLEAPFYYLIMYPIARSFSNEKTAPGQSRVLRLLKDPIIIVYFSGIIMGLILNFSGIRRPGFFGTISSVLVPLSSFLLINAIGYTMRFNKIGKYTKETVSLLFIKYVLSLAFVISISLLLGLDKVANGLLFYSLIILSSLPSGFNSLIPVQLYKLDLDLANSNWIVTTGFLIVVVPVLWLLIG